ncbi:MAG: proteasome assembly chaperone family protein [Aeropyrum sp.]|nr:proteasome assembly chaperone family protein [Aeropyrum sp.]MCE4615945.1 proteasome assembly chaperone family protein [Aeropyrum sp.]
MSEKGIAFTEEIYGWEFLELEHLEDIKYLVVGLPDVGLVGAITSAHLIKSLEMTYVAGVDNYGALPPVTIINKGEPMFPVRIYRKSEIAVLTMDVPMTPSSVPSFGSALVEYARRRGVDTIISVTGIGNPKRFELEKPQLYWLASDRKAALLAGGLRDARQPEQGIIVGPYSIILKESMKLKMHNLVLLTDAFIDLPDPEAAARVVEGLNSLLGLGVSVDELLKQAEEIKLRMRELMKETKAMMARMGKEMEYRAPILYT